MRSRLRTSVFVAASALAPAPLAGCATVPYVWIDDAPAPRAAEEYVIAPGDVLGVRVFNQENMSARARVRSDGKIALPFLGDVEVRGKTPAFASKELATRFKDYVVSPVVTVSVEETQPTAVSVLGEVAHPGTYTLDPSAGVLQALAAAGGFTEYASRDGIYVVRRGSGPRIRFTFSSLNQGEGRAPAFRLRAGDVVVVE
jgi:polysaccharide export outer membrane protein